MFVGRKEEIKLIEELLNKKGFQGCLVYGRRRLGKTELLKHCLLNKNQKVIFFQAQDVDEEINLNNLIKIMKEVFNKDYLFFESFFDAIKYIFEKSKDEKIYLVIDEYQFLRSSIKGSDGYLQNIIDFSTNYENMYLFICGSSISIMKDILSHSNPLYRRFQTTILLKELDYLDSSKFYENFSDEDKVYLYSAFGGVPYYLKQIDNTKSVKENIINLISGKYAHLEEDIRVNLKEEMTKLNNANTVFNIIALNKAYHFNDILIKSNIKTSSILSDVLERLLKMDLIEKVSPINDMNNKQKSGYKISSNLISFYYRYVYTNSSIRNVIEDEVFFDEYIENDFKKQFVPKIFENIAKEFLIRKSKNRELNYLIHNIGKFYYDDLINKRNGEFDVVTLSKDGYRFYEVKFKKEQLTLSEIKKEIKQVNDTSLKAINFGFISKNGFDKDSSLFIKENNIENYTLKDIYKIK